jgi:hypothetical protein
MTSKSNLWEAGPVSDANNRKNVVVFALRSMGRADLPSTAAGASKRNRQTQNQIKNSTFNFIYDGKKFTAVPTQEGGIVKKSTRRSRRAPKTAKAAKPAKQAQPQQAKSAKPAKAAQSVNRSNQSSAPLVRKPPNVSLRAWKGYSLAVRAAVAKEWEGSFLRKAMATQPPTVNQQRRRKPNQDGSSNMPAEAQDKFDSEWTESRYKETADPYSDPYTYY